VFVLVPVIVPVIVIVIAPVRTTEAVVMRCEPRMQRKVNERSNLEAERPQQRGDGRQSLPPLLQSQHGRS